MNQDTLLPFKSNIYSQNGEDGIIAEIFSRIGATSRTCCEFGAWDGIHFSNCRKLILEGWHAVMIEGEQDRFKELVANYSSNPSVICVNTFVDSADNDLHSILQSHNVTDLDFLSIDIDGLDYQILETLKIRPHVISIEVNAGHNPTNRSRLPREVARNNIGQPLQVFVEIAEQMGYDLVCYTGNAFMVRRDFTAKSKLPVLSGVAAYQAFVDDLSKTEKEWLYMVNLGVVPPYYRYDNPYLSRAELKIGLARAILLRMTGIREVSRCLMRRLRGRARV